MTPGIHAISEREYHSDPSDVPALSSSIAKILLAESPWHAWHSHPKLNPNFVREEKELFDIGTVAHALMLQGLEVADVLTYADWKTVASREHRQRLRDEGKIPILSKHWERVQVMVQAGKEQIAKHREANDAFTAAGKPELTLTWTDDHGVICRARLDWLRDDYRRICDYKSTGACVNPESIGRYALSQGWEIQSAFYRRGVKKLTGIDPEFFFVAQEDYAPHALAVIGMGPDFAWSGDRQVQMAIDRWAQCLESGEWPAYPDRVAYPILPAWKENQIIESEVGR